MPDTATIPDSLLQATIAQLAKHAPFDQMDKAHLYFLAGRLKLSYHPKGDVLLQPKQGVVDRFFIIKQGGVAGLQDESAGIQWQLMEGECFPLGALLAKRPVSCTYQAIADTFCYELSDHDFAELLRISLPFHDFCTRRIANLLEQSQRVVQADYSNERSAQQSLNTPLSSLVRRLPVTCSTDQSIRAVLKRMQEEHIGSMIIMQNDDPVGIFTLHDLLERVALPQADLQQPIGNVMSHKPVVLPGQAFAHEAALAMARHGIRHVLVTEGGKLSGIVSEKDLFALQRVGLGQISSAIRGSADLASLKQCAQDIQQLVHNMLAQGVAAEQLTQIVSTLNDLLTSRIIELELAALHPTERQHIENHFCWLALGSEGRFEQTLLTDQDNGIIFDVPDGSSSEAQRQIFLPFALRINEALDACGFPKCKGEVMASNPKWCLSLDEWQDTFGGWIYHGDPKALLYATIFFDFRPLYGEIKLGEELRAWLAKSVQNNTRFLHQMAVNALRNRPPLGLVRDFSVGDDHALDLKLNGVIPFVDAARIYSLATGGTQTNTLQRLREMAEPLHVKPQDAEAWGESFLFIQLLRLRLQHDQTQSGQPLSNRINPDQFNDLDRRILKEAFRQARKLQTKLALDYQV